MFDIGFWEIFLILVLALIVIGPERLPRAAKTAGYWVGRARRFVEGVKSDVEQEFDVSEFKRLMHNQEVQINELQRKLSETADLSGDNHEEHRYEMHDEVADDETVEQLEQDAAEQDAAEHDVDHDSDIEADTSVDTNVSSKRED